MSKYLCEVVLITAVIIAVFISILTVNHEVAEQRILDNTERYILEFNGDADFGLIKTISEKHSVTAAIVIELRFNRRMLIVDLVGDNISHVVLEISRDSRIKYIEPDGAIE
jgi:hypothetical protein